MFDRFEILYSRARRLVSRTRWSAQLLGHPSVAEASDEPGLILIQIDGLGENEVREALKAGHMPFLTHLVEADGYHVLPVYTGLPSSTPGFQAELFYGVANAVPAFAFKDPLTGTVRSMNHPASASAIEASLDREHRGLLENGSAWSNIYSGGATEAHLCASTAGFDKALRALTPVRVLRLFLWHGWNVVRVLGNLLVITGLVFWDLVRGRLPWQQFVEELRYVPARVVVSAVMREIVTTGATVDAERGLPIIHLNYLGYDEHSHRRGPRSRLACWSLRGIDRAIRRVWMAGHRSRQRDYQVWIHSDHGQEEVVSYDEKWGRPVSKTVQDVYARLIAGESPSAGPAGELSYAPATGDRLQWLGMRMPRWLAAPRSHILNGQENGEASASVHVIHQGPVGFVYLPPGHDRVFVEQLAKGIVGEGVPAVIVAKAEREAAMFTAEGTLALPEDAAAYLGSDHPHLHAVAKDLVRQAHHPAAGELVLLGWNSKQPLSLQRERGSHGGPGPKETSAFLILPPEAPALTPLPGEMRPASIRRLALENLAPVSEPPSAPGITRIRKTPAKIKPEGLKGTPIRLMTYNVHGCRGMDGVFAPQRIARVIARERPDFICLQELDQKRTRSGGVDQVHVIAERLELDYHFHTVAEVDDGRFGNAILSTQAMKLVQAKPLPAATRVKDVLQLEDRGALWVTTELDGEMIHIINTHLSILDRERRLQIDALVGPDWLGSPRCQGSVIFAGDLNASPESWSVRRLEARLRNTIPSGNTDRRLRTWTGRTPLRRIDHVLASNPVVVSNVRVPRTRLSRVASDHLPLVVDLLCPAGIGRRTGAASETQLSPSR